MRINAKLFCLAALTIICCTNGFAQPKSILDKTIFVDYGERFHADAYVVPTSNIDSAQIVVFFRMANDFLTFEKNNNPADIGGNFIAPMSVGIELRDTIGIIRQRLRWEGNAYTNDFDETNNKNKFHYGWTVFTVGSGTYDISLEILSVKESAQKTTSIPSVSYNPSRPLRLLTAPLFAEPTTVDSKQLLKPFVFSGNVAFTNKDAVALILLADSEPTSYDYIIEQAPYGIRDINWWQVFDIRGSITSSTTRFPRFAREATTKEPFLEVVADENRERSMALVELLVPITVLVPGNYSIKLIRQGSTDTLTSSFRIVWEMMPLSLRNLDYAMSMLKYIAREEVIDSLDEGSDVERRLRLMNWWRLRDRTQTTTFNERMAEYYARIDQAFFAFGTIQEPDGADTERGKIYILFGAPTTITKELPRDGSPLEIWTYTNKVNKVFTFTIDDNGMYKLVEMRDASTEKSNQN